MKNVKSFILGVVVTVALFGLSMTAYAAYQKTITVVPGVQIYMNDSKLDPKDANGNPVDVFIYNGTTYLPVRAVSEALGIPVQWEGKTQSVYLGKHSSDKPAVMLKDLDDYVSTRDGFEVLHTDKDNLGNTYVDSVTTSHRYYTDNAASESYKINGQYSAISGTFYQRYDSRSSTYYEPTLFIFGDGELLYAVSVGAGVEPIDFTVDISGVLDLKIEIIDNPGGSYAAIGNCGLYT